jgi:uncharacterized RDD family membrane protein YckC
VQSEAEVAAPGGVRSREDLGFQPAGFGVRLVAAVLDAALLAVLFVAAVAVVSIGNAMLPQASSMFDAMRRAHAIMIGASVSLLVVAVAYTGMDVLGRGTVGKRLLKLRVAAADGTAAARGRLLARWALKYGPVVALLAGRAAGFVLWSYSGFARQSAPDWTAEEQGWWMIASLAWGLVAVLGFLLALMPGRRALHDIIARTMVLRPGEGPRGFTPIVSAGK